MNVLPIILTELWMDEYPKCPARDKTNTEESQSLGEIRALGTNSLRIMNELSDVIHIQFFEI